MLANIVNQECTLGHVHNGMRLLKLCNSDYVVNKVRGLGHIHSVLMTVRNFQ